MKEIEITVSIAHTSRTRNSIVCFLSNEGGRHRSMMRVNNMRIVDAATDPKVPIRPRTLLNVGAGSSVGFLFGVGLVIARQQLDSSIKTPQTLRSGWE